MSIEHQEVLIRLLSQANDLLLEIAQDNHQGSRPAMAFKPRVFLDGNKWCALYGEDLQIGVAGFGDTPELATRDFDRNWHSQMPPPTHKANKEQS